MANPKRHQFPAAIRVCNSLRERIATGHYCAGAWLPAERDLADEFSVSRPVVREAISRLADQGFLTRSHGCRPRVVDGSQTTPSKSVWSSQRSTRQTIAAIIPHQPSYCTAQAILRGINHSLIQKEAPFSLSVFDTYPFAPQYQSAGEGTALERSVLERIEEEGVAGVIVWHYGGSDTQPLLSRLQESGVPLVFIDRYPTTMDCDYVGVDNHSGVQSAVEYLLRRGHRRIAYLTNSEDISTVNERLDGFRSAFVLHGMRYSPELIFSNPNSMRQNDWNSVASELISRPDPPTAAVVVNDFQAFAFMSAVRNNGKGIPEDISVVGFDDIESYSPHQAVLTTISQPFYQVGQRAADLLLQRTQRPQHSTRTFQHIILPTQLIERSTCRSLRDDPVNLAPV